MIIISGPVLFLLILCLFRPVRVVLGWLLFLVICAGVYGCCRGGS